MVKEITRHCIEVLVAMLLISKRERSVKKPKTTPRFLGSTTNSDQYLKRCLASGKKTLLLKLIGLAATWEVNTKSLIFVFNRKSKNKIFGEKFFLWVIVEDGGSLPQNSSKPSQGL